MIARVRKPLLIAGAAGAAVLATGWFVAAPSGWRGEERGLVRVPDAATPAAPPPVAGSSVGIALHSVFVGGTPASSSAMIAAGGAAPAQFRIGQDVVPGVRLAEVHADRVVLVENGRPFDLYLLGGGPGGPAPARKGLDPEPVRPSGELPAEEIIARQAADPEPVQKTPEEIAAGR